MTIVQIILAAGGISLLIAWHELGHYLAARMFGMRVVRYALGLGPKMVGFEKGGIQYQLSWLPFGGFVQIFGMTPFEPGAIQDPRAFINQPRWQRIIVYAAGPAFNYILAAALFFGFFWSFPAGTVHIAEVVDQSAAQSAGLAAGDVIYGIEGQPLKNEADFLNRVDKGQAFEIYVRRDAAVAKTAIEKQIAALDAEIAKHPAASVASQDDAGTPTLPAVPLAVEEAAERLAARLAADAGVEPSELATALKVGDGQRAELLSRRAALTERLQALAESAKTTTTARPDAQTAEPGPPPEEFRTTVTPQITKDGPRLGVRYTFMHDGVAMDVSIVDIALASVVTCYTQSVSTLRAIGKKFAGDKSVKFEGPLGIGKHITKAVERGPRDLVWILALLSVTLGLFNLLPIPALDGIKILILSVEALLRRNINPVFQLWLNALGLLALIVLMVVMTVYDASALMG